MSRAAEGDFQRVIFFRKTKCEQQQMGAEKAAKLSQMHLHAPIHAKSVLFRESRTYITA